MLYLKHTRSELQHVQILQFDWLLTGIYIYHSHLQDFHSHLQVLSSGSSNTHLYDLNLLDIVKSGSM